MPLPYLAHVRILLGPPLRPLGLVRRLVVEAEHGVAAADGKAAAEHDEQDDGPWGDDEAHVVALVERREVLGVWNVHVGGVYGYGS